MKLPHIIILSLVGVCLIGPAFGQAKNSNGFSGKNWALSGEFFIQTSKTTITQSDTNQKITLPYADRGLRLKFGPLFDTKNLVYAFLSSAASSKLNTDPSLFQPGDTSNDLLDSFHSFQAFGIGYERWIGNVSTRSFNYYVGLEAGVLSYNNTFSHTHVLENERDTGSGTMFRLFFGGNFLLGSADFHLEAYYQAAKGPKSVKIPSPDTAHTYTETSDFSSPGFSFGINDFF